MTKWDQQGGQTAREQMAGHGRASPRPSAQPNFLNVLRTLCSTLEQVTGKENASALVSQLSDKLADSISDAYRNAYEVRSLTREQVCDVIVDLKSRLGMDYYVASEGPDRIVLANRSCPFGETSADRVALCTMSSQVMSKIAETNLGYGRGNMEPPLQPDAPGAPRCQLIIYFEPDEDSGDAPLTDVADH